MSPSGRIDPADFVLGELSGPDRAEAERLMAEDAAFRAEVERLRPVVSRLDELPAEAWQELGPRERPAAPEIPAPSRRRRLSLSPALAGAFGVVLLVVGLGVGLAINNGGGDGGGEDIVVTLEPVTNADAGAEGRADLNERDGVAEVAVKGLAPTAAGETYELWLLNSPEELVSLGRFSVPDTGDTDVRVSLPASAPEFRYLDISREPPDGNPGHSGVSVLRAEV